MKIERAIEIRNKIKLKPCPFCGCEMAIDFIPQCNINDTIYFLVGKPKHAEGCMIGAMVLPRSHDKAMMVEYWNRRADNG